MASWWLLNESTCGMNIGSMTIELLVHSVHGQRSALDFDCSV